MYYRELIYNYRRVVRNLRARLRRAKLRWGNKESYVKRLDLEKIMESIEWQIEECRDRIAYYKECE